MLHAAMSAPFEDVQKADQITVDVRVRIGDRIAYAGLRREMNDPVKSLRDEQRLKPTAIAELHAHKTKARSTTQPSEACVFERRVVVVVHVVESDDLITAGEQSLGRVGADKTRRASHQKFCHAIAQEDG